MAYTDAFGKTDIVLKHGRIPYVGDGTHAYPQKGDSDGHTHVDVQSISAGSNNIGDVDVASIAAGTTRIGTVSGVLKQVSVTKVLSAATAYHAGDVLSESATNNVGTAWTFSGIARADAAYGYITKAHVISETTAIVPRLVLYLFNATPTCELDDHAANTALLHADLAKYIGRIDFPAMSENGTGDAEAIATPSTYGNLPLAFQCAAAADDIIGVLVTMDAFTQDAGDDMTIVLTVEQY